jgi:hypothetical protein
VHAIDFIQDLAVIMLIAGVVTVLFHHLRQPVVLGYLVAGVIIGPHTPPFALIHDQETIATLAAVAAAQKNSPSPLEPATTSTSRKPASWSSPRTWWGS